VGNDPVYVKTTCFEKFPFPAARPEQQARIAALAEQLDAHRKRQQAAHPELTLTGMYNVLAKLKRGEPLTAKDKTLHEAGLVAVLRQLHDESMPPCSTPTAGPISPPATPTPCSKAGRPQAERAAEEPPATSAGRRPAFQPSVRCEPGKP
jgi:hypothetical protein